MRLVIPTLTAMLAAGLVGCSDADRTPPTPPPAPAPEPFVPRVAETEVGKLDLAAVLSERTVEALVDGPWSVRRTLQPGDGGAKRREAASKGEKDELTEDAPVTTAEIRVVGGSAGSFGGRGGGRGAPRAGGAFRGPVGEVPGDSREPSDPASGPTTGGGDAGGESGDDVPPPARSPAADPREGGDVLVLRDREALAMEVASSHDEDKSGSDDGEERDSADSSVVMRRRPGGGGGAAPSAPPARDLKAGATDDNDDYEAYLEFLGTWVEKKDVRELFHQMDVSERCWLSVTDESGAPVPGAIVSVVDEVADRVVFTGTTYGDGRVAFYPHMAEFDEDDGDAPRELLVEAYLPGDDTPVGTRTVWDGTGEEFELVIDGAPSAADPLQLDVCLLIDTTGSMSDEIASIKQALLRMTQQLRSLDREFDLRYSAVLYRDIGDQYLTASHPFTSDVEAFDEALRKVDAAGGGDGPESLNQGLAEAVTGVEWRPGAAKVVFLIADAQPHMDYAGDTPYGETLQAAVAKGVKVHSVAASGLNAVGTLVFRQIAQYTRGKFIFIEYGSSAASAASHGVAGKVKSNNLEDILFEQIREELAMHGRR